MAKAHTRDSTQALGKLTTITGGRNLSRSARVQTPAERGQDAGG